VRRSSPYDVFPRVEQYCGLHGRGTHEQRAHQIWRWSIDFWKQDHTMDEVKEHLGKQRHVVGVLMKRIFAAEYKVCSRARWLCSAKSFVRIGTGLHV